MEWFLLTLQIKIFQCQAQDMKVIGAYKWVHKLCFKDVLLLFGEDKLCGIAVQDKPFFLIPNP